MTIHALALQLLLTTSDWHSNLQPGGYIELFDPIVPLECDDGTLDKDSALAQWDRLILESSIRAGSPTDSAYRYEQQLRDAGFINTVRTEFKWPINPWPKDPKYKQIGEQRTLKTAVCCLFES